jgi:hypothetical protein
MSLYEKLTVANLVVSCLTLALFFVALVPHMKQGLTVVRDAVLWVAMLVVICLLVSAVWLRVNGTTTGSAAERTSPGPSMGV